MLLSPPCNFVPDPDPASSLPTLLSELRESTSESAEESPPTGKDFSDDADLSLAPGLVQDGIELEDLLLLFRAEGVFSEDDPGLVLLLGRVGVLNEDLGVETAGFSTLKTVGCLLALMVELPREV